MEKPTEHDPWQGRASKLFCVIVLAVLVWLILTYASAVLTVFLIAWAVAAVIDPLARRTEKKLRISHKLCAAFYVVALLFGLGFLVFLGLSRLAKELEELILWAEENQDFIGQKIGKLFESMEKLSSQLPFMEHADKIDGLAQFGESVDAMASRIINETVSEIGAWVTAGIGKILRAAPKFLIGAVVSVIACFYLSMDYVRIRDRLIGLLPPAGARRAHIFRQRAGKAIRSYVRAYLLLLVLTFIEVFAGLLILRQKYAFLIAWLVALVDILPIFGAGTVLVPWAVIMLFLKNYYLGFGLLILYGVITIVRQVAEPHIIGGSLGIHPLLTLFFMFTGFQLFGVFGMLLGPAAALIVKEFLKEKY